jgi:hypothetical protein
VIQTHRESFNRRFREESYARALASVEAACGGAIPFRVAESPLFLPAELLQEMRATSEAILAQVVGTTALDEAVRRYVPPAWLGSAEGDHPLFLAFDYALARDRTRGVRPLLTELQGFPSLFAFQHALSRAYRDAYQLAPELEFLCVEEGSFLRLFRTAVLGAHDPETVALVDIHPWLQGTWPDFRYTQQLCPGLAVLHAGEVVRRGRSLFYRRDGRDVPVRRIYNRMVWEDLAAHEAELPFHLRDDLEVEWADHPNWFFKLSKLCLPLLEHANVPRAFFLDQLDRWPDDLDGWVLKPLFSFSGRGLVLDLDRRLLEGISPAERRDLILQEKFHYAEVIPALEGTVRCEVRLLYVWIDRPVCLTTLPRMSRGRLMGCAFNRTEPWTGHGTAFFPRAAG